MKLLNTLLIIFGLSINQVLCNTIEDEIHERFERSFDFPEKIKDILRHGDETLGVRGFDPYEIENYHVNVARDDLTVKGKLSDVIMIGLSDIVGVDMKNSLMKKKTELFVKFPFISAKGKYSIDRIRTHTYTQNAYGDFKASMDDLVVRVDIKYSFRGKVSIDKVEIVDIGSIKIFGIGEVDHMPKDLVIVKDDHTPESALHFCKRFHITQFFTQVFGDTLSTILNGKSVLEMKNLVG